MKISHIISLLVLAVALWSCQADKENPKAEEANQNSNIISITKKQFQLNGLKLTQPQSVKFAEEIVVNGMIDVPPENRAIVNSYFEGYVSQTALLIGDEVKKGGLLIKLKNPQFVKIQQEYVEALANLDFQTAEFNRKSNLLKENVIAQKVFQKTKNDYLSAKARVSATREQIKLMNLSPNRVEQGSFTSEISIFAPISGKISKMDVSQGKFVGQSDRIMEIVNTDHVHLELNVFEKDLSKIEVGQKFQFSLPESSSERLPAHVKLIGAEIDTEKRFVKVHAHPDDEDKNYIVGMYVTAYFQTNSKNNLALPETAFTELDAKTFVLKLNQETDSTYVFTKKAVKTTPPQNNHKALLDTKTNSSEQYLANGVFDILTEE